MTFQIEESGNKAGPLLVCLHSLMGGPDEFSSMAPAWLSYFRLITVDLNPNARATEWGRDANEDESQHQEAMAAYDHAAEFLGEYLQAHYPQQKAYFVGISFGSKIVYDLISKNPRVFLAGVTVDIGPGHVVDSDLYQFADKIIPAVDLSQPAANLRGQLEALIPEKTIRILIQSQIDYPDREGPGRWRSSMEELQKIVMELRITDQWKVTENMPGPMLILKAEYLSAVSAKEAEALSQHPDFTVKTLPRTAHFINITHPDEVTKAVLSLINK